MKERELFLAALEIEDPVARLSHLKTECGDDAALLARVESLLASHEGQSQFLNTPVAEQFVEISDAEVSVTSVVGSGSTQEEEPDATTLFTPGKSRMTEQPDDAGDKMRIGYLEPSTKPGSLGRLAHYEVLQVIGRGAFGIVLRAFDEKLQRVVAIKLMSPEMASTSPARKRFLREAQASAAIRHEHVVSVYAVEEKPIPYLVMEYIPGLTLQQRLDERGPLDVPTVLRLGRQIAEGLEAAHSQDLIHRDIKPGNILLEAGLLDKVKITDFGLARAADDASLTQSGTIAGTPMYMAPEQALGHKLDRRADLFSLGSVLYQMASGRPPFRAPTALAVLKRVVEETPRPIREIIPETPQWLCDIIAKLHAKNPDDRYQSAQEVADVLADCEVQLMANARLRDFSRIPRSKSASSANRILLTAGGIIGTMLLLGVIIAFATKEGTKAKTDAPETSRSGSRETSEHVATTDDRSFTKNGWPANAPQPAIAPFDVAQARTHQDAWARHLGIPVEYTNSIGMKFRLIPPGEFLMGSAAPEIKASLKAAYPTATHWHDCIRSEAPQHKVILMQPIYLGIHEVTQADYQNVMGTNPSHFSPNGPGQTVVAGMETSQHPVERVSSHDVVKFCDTLSQREKLIPRPDVIGYRLPTEAEWEFACRAGTTTKFWIGDDDTALEQAGWFGENSSDRTHAVGELKANPFGLFDVHGNVWEWVQDGWEPGFYREFANKPAIDPISLNSSETSRIIRGGRWYHDATYCRSAFRLSVAPTDRFEDLGFRVALSVDAVKATLMASNADSKEIRSATLPVGAPFTEADIKLITVPPATSQVEEVRKELKKRNPEFDGTLIPTIENEVVTEIEFFSNHVSDISPLRAFPRLSSLNCRVNGSVFGTISDLKPLKGMSLAKLILSVNPVSDLSPLKGMPLTELHVDNSHVADLSPLEGMPLKVLNCSYTKVTSLAPLKGMPLVILWCNNTRIDDLTPVKGMPLEWITIHGTKVNDIAPLKGLPLKQIYLDFDQKRDSEVLRSLTTLQKINETPAAGFRKNLD